MEDELKLIHWNINGRSGYSSAYAIPPFITNEIIDGVGKGAGVIVLTEFVITAGWHHLVSALERFYFVATSPYVSKQNGVLIAVRKDLIQEKSIPRVTSDLITTQNEKPNFLQVEFVCRGVNLTIIGTRVRVGSALKADYQDRKTQIVALREHLGRVSVSTDNVIVVGDFNNSRICGDERKSYDEVREEYHFRNDGGVSDLYDTYNYHILKQTLDCLTPVYTTPSKEDFSWVDSNRYRYKQDHLFIKGMQAETCVYDWAFVTKENGYGQLSKWGYKSNLAGYPDHAVLSAIVRVTKSDTHDS